MGSDNLYIVFSEIVDVASRFEASDKGCYALARLINLLPIAFIC
ncbi:MAG: hypothetical protein OFPI_18960 [Osedax symbiont Rs2]|nr:MAG: hypothetical protein OFPI_18960 [Osedax symbiont Rs2]